MYCQTQHNWSNKYILKIALPEQILVKQIESLLYHVKYTNVQILNYKPKFADIPFFCVCLLSTFPILPVNRQRDLTVYNNG